MRAVCAFTVSRHQGFEEMGIVARSASKDAPLPRVWRSGAHLVRMMRAVLVARSASKDAPLPLVQTLNPATAASVRIAVNGTRIWRDSPQLLPGPLEAQLIHGALASNSEDSYNVCGSAKLSTGKSVCRGFAPYESYSVESACRSIQTPVSRSSRCQIVGGSYSRKVARLDARMGALFTIGVMLT